MPPPKPLLSQIDYIQLAVPDLEAALTFYRDQLGHKVIWRSDQAAGQRARLFVESAGRKRVHFILVAALSP